ncbi:putative reverse transcriptase domain-containing protein [Tanacetum coccineum]
MVTKKYKKIERRYDSKLQEVVKLIRGSGKTTKVVATTTTTATTPTTTIKTEDKKLLKFMLQPQLKGRNCQKVGHQSKDCKSKTPATGSNTQQVVTCYGCGEKGHYKNKCPNKKDQ